MLEKTQILKRYIIVSKNEGMSKCIAICLKSFDKFFLIYIYV